MTITTGKYFSTIILLTAMLLTERSGYAATAANTRIVNTATVTYNSGRTVSASVTVTVALVPSTPNITINSGSGSYTAPNTPPITDTITITATANGPAEYTVTPSIPAGGTTNVSLANPASVNINNNPNTIITIGASVTTGTSGQTFVTVPAGSVTGNNSPVNGIGLGSTIVFTVNGTPYTRTVTGTTCDASNSTCRIDWSGEIPPADVPAAGVLVAEQKTVSVAVLPGTVQTVGIPITVTVQGTVSIRGAADATATTAVPNSWTTTTTNASLVKYVRNVTAANGSGSPYLYNSFSYYSSGVQAKPGDVLEYILVSTNSGSDELTGSSVADLLPITYATLKTGQYPGGKDVTYVSDTNSVSYYSAAADTDPATYSAGTALLTVNLGNGATSSAGGTIPGNNKHVLVLYQVTVNP